MALVRCISGKLWPEQRQRNKKKVREVLHQCRRLGGQPPKDTGGTVLPGQLDAQVQASLS